MDHETGEDAHERGGDELRNEKRARLESRSLPGRLEVQRQVLLAADGRDAVEEGDHQRGGTGALGEQCEGHQRIFRESLLAVDEEHTAQGTKDDQTDDLRRRPGKRVATKIKSQQHHESERK